MENATKKFVLILLVVILLFLTAFFLICRQISTLPAFSNIFKSISLHSEKPKINNFKTFNSEQEFKEYLKAGSYLAEGWGMGRGGALAENQAVTKESAAEDVTAPSAAAPERVSETNVQVAGIDEPDIVKTDGQELYISSRQSGVMPLMRTEPAIACAEGSNCIMPPRFEQKTSVVHAFPPADITKKAIIEKGGNLLLNNKTLVIFSSRNIYGFDISDPASPKEKWNIELKNNTTLTESRLYRGKIYLVERTTLNTNRPCPLEPMLFKGDTISVRCAEIYHPISPLSVDATYTVIEIDPEKGSIRRSISFVGSSNTSTLYMSPEALYLAYWHPGDSVKFSSEFLKENKDLVPEEIITRINKLQTYDISSGSKYSELSTILEQYFSGLDDDEQLRIEQELRNRSDQYFSRHKRELDRTEIMKIKTDDLGVIASGTVAGKLLNQFSMDEYQDNLRVATTVGSNWWMPVIGGGGQASANDVYVLDKNLHKKGEVTELGTQERIYAARFIGDKGYLVTFRQTDPFFVLDLSNPRKPELKGELKIPGYSSYLHPIDQEKILGIGKEDNQVKISLFDISDPKNPAEISKYKLDEYWSDILNTHRAFLLDSKHKIFFLPGSKGGYVFSYADQQLQLVKAISGIQIKRAVYINDYLYIIGDDKITVLNEQDWEKVNQLEL